MEDNLEIKILELARLRKEVNITEYQHGYPSMLQAIKENAKSGMYSTELNELVPYMTLKELSHMEFVKELNSRGSKKC